MNDAITTDSTVTPMVVAALGLVAVVVVVLAWVLHKGRPFAKGDVFRASRMTRGNRLFPTQVLVTPTSVVHFTPQWIGQVEHSIHIAHVASVSIDTNVLFSDVYIETTGGTTPIHCRGHRKQDAIRIKQLIETYQTGYHRRTSTAETGAQQPGVGPAPS
ncbi:MAG: hypothetical protein AB7I50_08205 [Vicinamibacterales bacterium]